MPQNCRFTLASVGGLAVVRKLQVELRRAMVCCVGNSSSSAVLVRTAPGFPQTFSPAAQLAHTHITAKQSGKISNVIKVSSRELQLRPNISQGQEFLLIAINCNWSYSCEDKFEGRTEWKLNIRIPYTLVDLPLFTYGAVYSHSLFYHTFPGDRQGRFFILKSRLSKIDHCCRDQVSQT